MKTVEIITPVVLGEKVDSSGNQTDIDDDNYIAKESSDEGREEKFMYRIMEENNDRTCNKVGGIGQRNKNVLFFWKARETGGKDKQSKKAKKWKRQRMNTEYWQNSSEKK